MKNIEGILEKKTVFSNVKQVTNNTQKYCTVQLGNKYWDNSLFLGLDISIPYNMYIINSILLGQSCSDFKFALHNFHEFPSMTYVITHHSFRISICWYYNLYELVLLVYNFFTLITCMQ